MRGASSYVVSINEGTSAQQASKAVSIDEVYEEMEEWRSTKTLTGQRGIPDALWKKILVLGQLHTPSKIQKIFGLNATQYKSKLAELTTTGTATVTHGNMKNTVGAVLPVELCEVKTRPEPPVYRPDYIQLATNTLIVEFCRADGKTMKIHTTTDSFSELMKSFFNGF